MNPLILGILQNIIVMGQPKTRWVDSLIMLSFPNGRSFDIRTDNSKNFQADVMLVYWSWNDSTVDAGPSEPQTPR